MDGSVNFREVSVELPGGTRALDRLTLTIGPQESVAFIGRSGAGKTTALRLINGLARPTSGTVLVGGAPHEERELPFLRRGIGYVIQGSGLFPHRTVFQNVSIVPRLLGWDEGRIRASVEDLLESVGLPFRDYASRFPRTLSGGEQQRVAIARAIVASPAILLCDEPFAALDPIVRRELQEMFLAAHRTVRSMLVFVTHDLAEALTVAARIVHFERGRVIADVPAAQYVDYPDPLVQQFVAASRIPSKGGA